jgi:hypothetical protein
MVYSMWLLDNTEVGRSFVASMKRTKKVFDAKGLVHTYKSTSKVAANA